MSGRSPDGSGSRASHEASSCTESSPEASIPNADAFHPSEFIRDEMEHRGWTTADLALRMGGDDVRVNHLALDMYFEVAPTDPSCRIGDYMACQLAVAFDVSCQYFKNLESAWLAKQSERTGA